MEQAPKFYRLDRRTIGNLGAAKRVLDNLTRISIAGSGLSAVGTVLGGGKIDLVLPIVASVVGITTTTLRDLIAYVIESAEISNPIKTTQS